MIDVVLIHEMIQFRATSTNPCTLIFPLLPSIFPLLEGTQPWLRALKRKNTARRKKPFSRKPTKAEGIQGPVVVVVVDSHGRGGQVRR